MANLTPAEKELLAVIQCFGNNIKPVARLVRKLSDNFGLETTEYMTKLPESIIDPLILSVAPKPKKTKVDKAIEDAKAAPAKLNKAAEEVVVEESKSTGNSRRLAIHVNVNSDKIQRVTHDVAAEIDANFQSGDKFWTGKQIVEKFDVNTAEVSTVMKILRDHNWIEYIDSARKNLGHKVK